MAQSRDVTTAELRVLEALWDLGPTSVRQLTERIYPNGGGSPYATVLKLLERLETKNCVRREEGSSPRRFVAAVDRDDLIEQSLQSTIEKFCAGSRTPLLLHLVDAERLTSDEVEILRKLIDEIESQPRHNPAEKTKKQRGDAN
jgi:predicted transcriptional regulator